MKRANIDPSRPIPRREFYQLLAARLTGRTDLNDSQAIRLLLDYGLVPDHHRQAIASTPLHGDGAMDHREAYAMVANLVEARSRARKMNIPLDGHKPVRLGTNATQHPGRDWFSLPAYAGEASTAPSSVLNYLDAAHIVLSAEPGLR
jgi:hypothetical protein